MAAADRQHRITAAAGAALLVTSARSARRRRVSGWEADRFRRANELPDVLHAPAWAIMQLGSLGGVFAVAAGFYASGRATTARNLAIAGTTVWGGVKLVKPFIGRGRPDRHLERVRIRGTPQTGGGFPSGHAAVSVTVAVLGAPDSAPTVAAALYGGAAVTSFARMYVGAHLPLDVVGGVGIGLVAGSLTRLAQSAAGG